MPDDSGEVGLEAAPPPELADAGVAVVDELLMDGLPEVLGLLPVERTPPAELGDDPLDELQVPEVELLGGEVVRGGGEVGHGGRTWNLPRIKQSRDGFYRTLAISRYGPLIATRQFGKRPQGATSCRF